MKRAIAWPWVSNTNKWSVSRASTIRSSSSRLCLHLRRTTRALATLSLWKVASPLHQGTIIKEIIRMVALITSFNHIPLPWTTRRALRQIALRNQFSSSSYHHHNRCRNRLRLPSTQARRWKCLSRIQYRPQSRKSHWLQTLGRARSTPGCELVSNRSKSWLLTAVKTSSATCNHLSVARCSSWIPLTITRAAAGTLRRQLTNCRTTRALCYNSRRASSSSRSTEGILRTIKTISC